MSSGSSTTLLLTEIHSTFCNLRNTSIFFDEKNSEHMKVCNEFLSVSESILSKAIKSSFDISTLQKIYSKFCNVLWYNFDDRLSELLEAFSRLYPNEFKTVHTYLKTFKFDRADGNILIQGGVQSGKTALIILTSLCYLSYDKNVIVLCRNSLADVVQFKGAFNRIVKDLKDKCSISHPNFVITTMKKKVRHPSLLVTNYREGNLKHIMKTRGQELKNTVLYIDEGDLRDDKKQPEFSKLTKLISCAIFVSATVQDILSSKWNITGSNIVVFNPNSRVYQGIRDIEINVLEHRNIKEQIFFGLCDIAIDTVVSPFHPKIVLLSLERKIVKMEVLHDQIVNNSFDNLIEKKVKYKLPNQLYKNLCVALYLGDGITYTFKGIKRKIKGSVGDFLLQFAQVRWTAPDESPETIIIISGDMASRGINFACYDPKDVRNNWHITHQLLTREQTSANTTQSLRLLGNFTDSIVPKLYTTPVCKDRILKSNDLCTALISCMTKCEHNFYKDNYDRMTTDKICLELPIPKKDKTLLKFSRDSKRWNWVAEEQISIMQQQQEDKEEDDKEELEGWLVANTDAQTKIYQKFEETLRKNFSTETWISRSDIINKMIDKDFDLSITRMHSITRQKSNIMFKKVNSRVKYNLVK